MLFLLSAHEECQISVCFPSHSEHTHDDGNTSRVEWVLFVYEWSNSSLHLHQQAEDEREEWEVTCKIYIKNCATDFMDMH